MMPEKKNTRKWLIFAHCFNMDGRAASQTITDKIPFLIRHGVDPIVISAPTGRRDSKFTHHQVFSPAPSGLIFEMRKVIENAVQSRWAAGLLKGMVTVLCLPFLVFEKLLINLDSHWSWFITAGLKGIALYRRFEPELIYSTAGPSSTHLAALWMKKRSKLKWIAEIHDPLVPENGQRQRQRQLFHQWLEKKIFEHADAVIYFTQTACENARRRTGISHNSFVLRPGATPPKIAAHIYRKRDRIHFGHFGSLASDRNLYDFIEALAHVLENRPDLKDKVVLNVYGTMMDKASRDAVKAHSLENNVVGHGRLESDPLTGKSGRHQVFEQMNKSDVLVLLHGSSRISGEYIPSKLYEYLLTGRPLAAVASRESELGRLLVALGYRVIEPDRLEEIETAISDFIRLWEHDKLAPVNPIAMFTVEKTVERLVGIADTCLAKQVS